MSCGKHRKYGHEPGEAKAMNSMLQRVAVLPSRGVMWPVRLCFLLFVFTVPFDGLNVFGTDVFTLTKAFGLFFGVVCLCQPGVCFARPPAAFWFFSIYAGVYFLQDLARTGGSLMDPLYALTLGQTIILLWITFNVFRHSPDIQTAFFWTLVVSIAILIVLSYFGVASVQDSIDTVSGARRIAGGGHPANYAGFLYGVGVLCGLGIVVDKRLAHLWRLASLPFVLLCAFACAFTGSRSGMLCAAAGVLVYGLAARGLTRKLKGILLVAMLLIGFAGLVLRTDVARERWYAAIYEQKLAAHDRIFYDAADMFIEKPLFGWGPGTCLKELADRGDDRLAEVRDTHNDIMWTLLATGLAGGGFFIAGLAVCVRAAWKGRNGPLGALALAIMASFLVTGMINTAHKRKPAWLIMGYALAAPYIAGRALSKAAMPTTMMKRKLPCN
jgi:O-antigen ligase